MMRLLAGAAVLVLSAAPALADNTPSVLQELSASLTLPAGDITIEQYKKLRAGQKKMGKELDTLEAAIKKKKMEVNVHVLKAPPGKKVPGPPGPRGKPGKPGADGKVGDAGPVGAIGKRGKPGKAGKPGVAGPPGPSGKNGTQGVPGKSGPAGKDGKDGKAGAAGKPGEAGKPGLAGQTGPAGFPGPPGSAGKRGPAGKPGEPGTPGTPGNDGAPGKPGKRGKTGPAGKPGKPGRVGPAGTNGAHGPRGPTGKIGARGKPGKEGPHGVPGRRGKRGLDKVVYHNVTKIRKVPKLKYNYVVQWKTKVVRGPSPASAAKGAPSPASQKGVPYGRLVNAINGHRIGGAKITFTESHDLLSKSVFSSSTGAFSVELPKGVYRVKVSKSGFSALNKRVTVHAGKMTRLPAVLSPIISKNEVRMILTWGRHPRDLDMFLKTPSGCIVSYRKKTCYSGGRREAKLNYDHSSAYGPETISIERPQNGAYKLWVKQFSATGSLITSNCQVLLIANGKISKLKLGAQGIVTGTGKGSKWEVMKLTVPGYAISNM